MYILTNGEIYIVKKTKKNKLKNSIYEITLRNKIENSLFFVLLRIEIKFRNLKYKCNFPIT